MMRSEMASREDAVSTASTFHQPIRERNTAADDDMSDAVSTDSAFTPSILERSTAFVADMSDEDVSKHLEVNCVEKLTRAE